MEAFVVSLTTIAVAEIGDRTQLLSLVLVARYRKPLPIIAGMSFSAKHSPTDCP
jgi:putative Ca2+/H+ antiporter (TMEM165/GDT1 family)